MSTFFPGASFQISQFEAGAEPLLKAINGLIIPGQGGENVGEGYHIPIYAAANHTRLESFEKEGRKGVFVIIGDEPPMYDDGDFNVRGTTPGLASLVFGDTLHAEIPMVASLKKLSETYHVFAIRPGATSHGSNPRVTKRWQDMFVAAGLNPQHVVEIALTKDIVPTIAAVVARVEGASEPELVDVLKVKIPKALKSVIAATKSIVPAESGVVKGSVGELAASGEGRERL